MLNDALSKIDKELKSFTGGQKEKAVSSYVADVLRQFCRQEEEFAQAIVQNDKTLSDCCKSVMSGAGNAVSDLEVYKKAVAFYFPGAGIEMEMKIDLCASVNTKSNTPDNIIHLSLDDLMDF